MNASATATHPYFADFRALMAVAVLGLVMLAPSQSLASTQDAPQDSLLAAVAEVPFEATADSLNLIASSITEVNEALVGVASAYIGLFDIDQGVPVAAAAQAQMPAVPQGESFITTLTYMPQSVYETVGGATDFMAAVEMAPMYVITDALSQTLFEAGLY